MKTLSSNDEFIAELKVLIDGWCERRCLKPLSRILGPYLGFNGLTDGWVELSNALKTVRAMHRSLLLESEIDTIADLNRFAERALQRS